MARRKAAASEPLVWKAAIYLRLSREDGNEQSLSIQNQQARLLDYIEASDGELELVGIYCDDGFTGTDTNRADFQRMLADIDSKKINCVIVKDPSRLSRNYIEAGHYMEQVFAYQKVRFISLELPALDSYRYPDQMNSIVVPIQNVINDDFCRQTSIKIRGVFNAKRRRGEFIGAFAPYGYRKDPKDKYHLVIEEEQAAIIRMIFQWYAYEGLSKAAIVRRLNDLGIPNPSLAKRKQGMKYINPMGDVHETLWSRRTIDGMLKNQVFLGHMVQGRQRVISYKVHKKLRVPQDEWFIVENTHDPIVDQDLFDLVQELMKQNTRQVSSSPSLHLFSGFLRCADCGRSMGRSHIKQYRYFTCRKYAENSHRKCSRHTIREDRLYTAVLSAIRIQIALIEDLHHLVEEITRRSHRKNVSLDLESLRGLRQQDLERIRKMIDELYIDFKSEELSKEEYQRLKKNLSAQEEAMLQVIANLNQRISEAAASICAPTANLASFLKHNNVDQLDRRLLVELVKEIRVHENNEITIVFAFADQHRHLVEYIERTCATETAPKAGQTGLRGLCE